LFVQDMFAAGTETSASTLEWAMSELLRHPHAMERLQEEIESIVGKHRNVNESDVANMKFLQCVVTETLRLYPAAPLALPHESAEAVTVGGYHIPNKTMVMVNVWAIGRDPSVWGADASEFKPERFMELLSGHGNSMDLTGQADFRMLPFSAGRRGCPGAALALPMIELALARMLHIFDWRLEGDPSELDMTEACSAAMPRQIPLFAFPMLRLPNCL
jgi:cytochrome P450